MYRKASEDEIIWRWGHLPDNLQHLSVRSSQALEVIGIHGVTAFAGDSPEGTVVSYAKIIDLVDAGFCVYITPLDSDPKHRTVELPNPVTEEIAELWNKIWQRKEPM